MSIELRVGCISEYLSSTGTCATMFNSEVQFGHAGACANQECETAAAKNKALAAAGAFVPASFDELNLKIK